MLAACASATLLAADPPVAPPRGAAPAAMPSSASRAAGAPIAVIDITYILDNYPRLKAASDQFKADMEAAEAALKKERDAIAKKGERLKSLKVGSPDFKALEEEIVKLESDWKLKVNRQKADFAERDAKNYLTAYQEISGAVKAYAERNSISLVLRFNGQPVDPNNPQSVQMELSKMVMYYHRDIDITDQVLAELKRSAPVAAQPPRGNAAPAQPRR
jgi:Skp family chaperone for outer membrane proteins